MPYIKQEDRSGIVSFFAGYHPEDINAPSEPRSLIIQGENIETVGDLNFAISSLIKFYLDETAGHSYTAYNGVIGVLDAAKLEFYRRVVAPYEDTKIDENGDVY